MPTPATGAAFVDGSGALVAADRGFLGALGVDGADASAALRARAEVTPALRAFLAGDGPALLRLEGPGGPVEVSRTPASGGALLVLGPGCDAERLEHAARSLALTRVAAGVAHDIKNPLNAMALQIALLGEKLSGSEDASSAAAAHLSALRDQVGRVNEVLRRFLDVADPAAPLGYTDVGALLGDVATLLGHEGRRRRIEMTVDAPPGAIRTSCDPGRVGRLVLGLFARALAETPDGGRLGARAEAKGPAVSVAIEHAAGDPDPDLGYYTGVALAAARTLGGALAEERRDGVARVTLALPRNEAQ